MAIGAHPDDTCLGLAGFAVMMAAYHEMIFITATNGELGGDPHVRAGEDRAAAELLGVHLIQWGLPDCGVDLQQATQLVNEAIHEFQPSMVFTHWPADSHPDHRTVAEATRSAARQVPCLLFFEGPTTEEFKPTLELDISSVWKQKLAALGAYASEMERGGFEYWADGKSRDRSWPRHKGGRCEAFSVHHGDLASLLIPRHAMTSATVFEELQVSAND
jgi:LmbE family N-acetylglucosaminyl deacetylase